MRINPEQLITFSVVAEYGNVSKAAKVLNLSQPAVSGQLKALQEQIGQGLYTRKAKGIVLTQTGEQLLPYAHAVARNVKQVAEHIQNLQNRPQRPITVGLSYALNTQAAPLVLKAEKIGLQLILSADTSASLVKKVHTTKLDAALVVSPVSIPEQQLDALPIGGDELRLILPVGHLFAEQGYLSLQALQTETLLWVTPGSGVHRQAEKLLESAGVVPYHILELGSLDAIRAALLQGCGVAILPASYVSYEVEVGLLHSVGIEAIHTSVTHLLVTPPSKVIGPQVRKLVNLLKGGIGK